MKAMLLSLAILGAQLTVAVADNVPRIRVEALCKARSAADKMMDLPESQRVADCVQDEKTSKEKLDTLWNATASRVRARCKSDAIELGTLSYLDLLTCIQMADDVKWPSSTAKASGNTTPKK
jgi:hypothetical protein